VQLSGTVLRTLKFHGRATRSGTVEGPTVVALAGSSAKSEPATIATAVIRTNHRRRPRIRECRNTASFRSGQWNLIVEWCASQRADCHPSTQGATHRLATNGTLRLRLASRICEVGGWALEHFGSLRAYGIDVATESKWPLRPDVSTDARGTSGSANETWCLLAMLVRFFSMTS
jgi:hypothetical protein